MKMTFGKHMGEDLSDIPIDYLKWVEENVYMSKETRAEINFEIGRREGDVTSLGRKVR